MTDEKEFHVGKTDRESQFLLERAARAKRKAAAEAKQAPESSPPKPATPRKRSEIGLWEHALQAASQARVEWEYTDQYNQSYDNSWWYWLRIMKSHSALREAAVDVVADTITDIFDRAESLDFEHPLRAIFDSSEFAAADDITAIVFRHWEAIRTVGGESLVKSTYLSWKQRGFANAIRIRWKNSLKHKQAGEAEQDLARVRSVFRHITVGVTDAWSRWKLFCKAIDSEGEGEMVLREDSIAHDQLDVAFPLPQQAYYVLTVFELHGRLVWQDEAERAGRETREIEWGQGWASRFPKHATPELCLGADDAAKTFGLSGTACRGWIRELVERGALRRTAHVRKQGESHRYVVDLPEFVLYLTAKSLAVWAGAAAGSTAERKRKGLSLD